MKFALFVFLAFCAFAARASIATYSESTEDFSDLLELNIEARGVLFKGILDFVEGIKNGIKKTVGEIIKKAEAIVDDVRIKVENAAKTVLKKIEQTIVDIEQKFRTRKDCLDKYLPDVKRALKGAQEDNGQCVRGTIMQAKDIVSQVQNHVDAIQDNIDAMQDMVADCLETNGSIFGASSCIMKQIGGFKDNIFGMIGNAKNLLVDATKMAATVAGNGVSCIYGVNVSAEKQIARAVRDIETCAAKKPE